MRVAHVTRFHDVAKSACIRRKHQDVECVYTTYARNALPDRPEADQTPEQVATVYMKKG